MAGKLATSWALSKQTLEVLKQDKQLVIFPLMSSIACLLVIASFAVPIWATTDFQQLQKDPNAWKSPAHYAVLFAFYLVNYFVIAFFNSGLVACAMNRFNGEDASVEAGLKAAARRFPQILGWAIFAATVGMVLRAISERAGIVGKIVIGLIGLVWTVATYFVVPVLVVEGVGPIEAVKRSAGIIRKTWGESLITNLGLGALSLLCFLVALVPLAIGIGLTIVSQSAVPVLVGVGVTLVFLVLAALVTSTLQVILQAALYRYAATGLIPEPFDGDLLKQVFRRKKDK